MPLNEESVEFDKSLSLGHEKLLGGLLIFLPLDGVVAGVKSVDHNIDAKGEAVVQQEGVRVEVICSATGGLVRDKEENPVDHMEQFEGANDLSSSFKLFSLNTAEEGVEDAEGKVVGKGLERHERSDLLGSEFVDTSTNNDECAQCEANGGAKGHLLLAFAP